MPENTRFLLGYGERLTARVPPPAGGGGPEPAYEFEEAIERLGPLVSRTASILDNLPEEACPDGEAVGVLTLHPQSLAKSYHPHQLLNEYNLRQVGSRPVVVEPDKWSRQGDPEPSPSTELFVAGDRGSFDSWANDMAESPRRVHDSIRRVEAVRAPTQTERLRSIDVAPSDDEMLLLEVVLHASDDPDQQYILSGFARFAEEIGVDADLPRRLHAGGLCFVPVGATASAVLALAEFAFLRVARPVPRLRSFAPVERSTPVPTMLPSPLPTQDAIDPDLRIAIFDGGLEGTTPFSQWAVVHDPVGISASVPELTAHGHDVTSAVLFGSLEPGEPAPQPYGVVDHYRVLDDKCSGDPYELYDVLRRIQDVLAARRYEFFNLSIGPALPVEDDEVHMWTAVLDEHLSHGDALAAMAVGNNGASDDVRIQVPSDCVNGLSVGAADSTRAGWSRADYSAIGPGRSPGRVKPDVLDFGGAAREPFFVYDAASAPMLSMTAGTSFATPSVLRLATGIRAHFGDRLSTLALKALLIHTADAAEHGRQEVGWGKVAADLDEIVLCSDGMVRVVYQGELRPSQYLRALIPMPDTTLPGRIEVLATFCYATPTDPQDSGSYTRSGLEVTFRPHSQRFSRAGAVDPDPRSFFQRSEFDSELRRDAHKWETTVHQGHRFLGTTLHDPVFDIHYNARSHGGAARGAEPIPYALVVTVRSNRTPDLYDQVVRSFAGTLEALQPIIEIPVRV